MKKLLVLLTLVLTFFFAEARENKDYWNNKLKIVSFRLPPPPAGYTPKIVDLNGDGKPIRFPMTVSRYCGWTMTKI